jgi:hypothetical protein
MKGQTKLKIFSSAYRYLVIKLRSLGHKVVFYPEQFTSQLRFPMTGTQMQLSDSNKVTIKMITIRFVYYIESDLDIHINKDIMAGQNSSIL